MRYTGDLGCKYRGIPHDMSIVFENQRVKCETCKICTRRFRWYKGFRGRVNNVEYLRAHVRNFAQRWGATKRIYHKTYYPEKCTINV